MSDSYYCANCWAVQPREALLYRCPQCGGADLPAWVRGGGARLRPVAELAPPWWRRILGDEGEPRCPDHPKARLLFHCPECERPLSERGAVRGKLAPLALGIAGPRSAGKTLYTLALVRELRRLQVGGTPLGILGLDDAEERFGALERQLMLGHKPDATPREAPGDGLAPSPRNFGWQIQTATPERRGAPPAFLSIYDVAGETWGLPSHEALARFDRYVASLSGLVFLVDGAAVARDRGYEVDDAWDPAPGADIAEWTDAQWLSRVRDRMGARARKVDLAIVVSKADHLWDRAGLEILKPGEGTDLGGPGGPRDSQDPQNPQSPEALLADLLARSGRSTLLAEAHQSFGKVRLFAVSSLGFCPGPTEVDGQGNLVRELSPLGVTDPVVWLLRSKLPALRRSGPGQEEAA
jgi:hypothetical protein